MSTGIGVQGLHSLHMAKGMDRQKPMLRSSKLTDVAFCSDLASIWLLIHDSHYGRARQKLNLLDDNLDILVGTLLQPQLSKQLSNNDRLVTKQNG